MVKRPRKNFVPDSDKYQEYHSHVQTASDAASVANAGREANVIEAARAVAEAKAKKEWKGTKPAESPADRAIVMAKADADKNKADIQDELARTRKA